jgi:hypothetical protein
MGHDRPGKPTLAASPVRSYASGTAAIVARFAPGMIAAIISDFAQRMVAPVVTDFASSVHAVVIADLARPMDTPMVIARLCVFAAMARVVIAMVVAASAVIIAVIVAAVTVASAVAAATVAATVAAAGTTRATTATAASGTTATAAAVTASSATVTAATTAATSVTSASASASITAASVTAATTTTIFGVRAGMRNRVGDQDSGCRQHPSNRKCQNCLSELHNYLHLLVLVINRKQSRCKTKAIAPGQSTLQHISRQRRQQRMAPRDRVRTGTVRSGGWIIPRRTVFLR